MAGIAKTRAQLAIEFSTGNVATQQNFEDAHATFLSMEEADISTLSEKVTPANDDWILIEDSADSNNKKKIRYSAISTSPGSGEANTLAIHPSATGASIVEAKSGTELRVKGLISSTGKITFGASGNDTDLGVSLVSSDVGLGNVTNDAQIKSASGDLNSNFSEKTSLLDADIFMIEDSAAGYVKKKAQIGTLPFAPEFTTISSKTVGYTVQASDNNRIHEANGTFTITLPDTTESTVLLIQNIGTGTITLSAAGTLQHSGNKLKSQYDSAIVWHRGSGNWGVAGKLGV